MKKSGQIISTKIIQTKAPYIMYNKLEDTNIVHNAFSTRIGGVSTDMFSTMNFSVKMGDSKDNVLKNFEIFSEENGFENLVMTDQTHTVNVRKVTKEDIGKGIYKEQDYKDIDGLITNEANITLVTSYADCVPLYFVDLENKAIGLSHSGWRGTVSRMGKVTLDRMKEEYGTKAENVIAAIGPSICVNCYEVSKDVAEEFTKEFDSQAISYSETTDKDVTQDMTHIVYRKDNEKYMLNLWAANYIVLKDAGIKKENISIPDICTCCNKEILFSHRGHNGKRGNLCAFLKIKG